MGTLNGLEMFDQLKDIYVMNGCELEIQNELSGWRSGTHNKSEQGES